MLNDLFICGVFAAIAFFVYKWFELIVLKKERLNIVSRLEGEHLLEYAKRLPIGIKSGGVKQEGETIVKSAQTPPHGKVLRWGLLMLGIGIGLVFACVFISDNDFQYGMSDWALVGCVALCGGLGLVISFIIEHNLFKKEE